MSAGGVMEERSVLLVIDVQEKYIYSYEQTLVDRINGEINKALAAGIPIVYVLNAGTFSKEASPLAKGLEIVSGTQVVKRHPSAFTSEEFVHELTKGGYGILKMVGVDGCVCVAATALDAVKQGLTVKLIRSCVGTINVGRFERKLGEMALLGVEIM